MDGFESDNLEKMVAGHNSQWSGLMKIISTTKNSTYLMMELVVEYDDDKTQVPIVLGMVGGWQNSIVEWSGSSYA